MAHHSYAEELEDLYNQVRDGFAASETSSLSSTDVSGRPRRQPHPETEEDSIISLYRGNEDHSKYLSTNFVIYLTSIWSQTVMAGGHCLRLKQQELGLCLGLHLELLCLTYKLLLPEPPHQATIAVKAIRCHTKLQSNDFPLFHPHLPSPLLVLPFQTTFHHNSGIREHPILMRRAVVQPSMPVRFPPLEDLQVRIHGTLPPR